MVGRQGFVHVVRGQEVLVDCLCRHPFFEFIMVRDM